MFNLNDVTLIVFGDFGVLTNTPWKDHQPLAMLPGRVAFLTNLRQTYPHLKFAVMGNKGGVAFGIQSEDEAREEVRWTAEQIGTETFAVNFAHPSPKPGFERYAKPELLLFRKPAPGMVLQLQADLGIPMDQILVVGDSEDRRVALSAGCAWQHTKEFFEPKRPSSEADDFDPFLDAVED